MPVTCGIDFGTSNSAVWLAKEGQVRGCDFEGGFPDMPSAIFFDYEDHSIQFGREAIKRYTEDAEGRLMRSLKSILGSDLINDTTALKNSRVSFAEVIGLYLSHLKQRAEELAGEDVSRLVLGRPVHYVDDDPKADALAQSSMQDIAHDAGFEAISFEYEPVAALQSGLEFLAQGSKILVCDIGGGTADYSVAEVVAQAGSKSLKFLSNSGVHIGGTDLDKQVSLNCIMPLLGRGSYVSDMFKTKTVPISEYLFANLSTWHRINLCYDRQVLNEVKTIKRLAERPELIDRLEQTLKGRYGHASLFEAERMKISLAEQSEVEMSLDFLHPVQHQAFSAEQVADVLSQHLAVLLNAAEKAVELAELEASDISHLMLTGGTSQLNAFRTGVQNRFPKASLIANDTYTSVAQGLAIMSMS